MAGVPADGEVALGALWIGRRRLLTMRRMAGSCYDGDGHAERATELLQPGNGFGASVADHPAVSVLAGESRDHAPRDVKGQ